MLDGTYLVEVDTPLGKKSAMVDLETRGEELNARVDAPIIGKQSATGTVQGNAFSAAGVVKVLLKGSVDFTVEGEVNDGILTANLKSSKGDLSLIGARL